ncbi:hypothetical protein FRC17_002335, partial [Serendipita sp. 399]
MSALDHSVKSPTGLEDSTVLVSPSMLESLVDSSSKGEKKGGVYEIRDWEYQKQKKKAAEEEEEEELEDFISRTLQAASLDGSGTGVGLQKPQQRQEDQPGYFSSLFSRLTGLAGTTRPLTQEDLAPVLAGMKEHLMKKNVAREIAERVCDGVGKGLEGKKVGGLKSIRGEVKNALEESITRILTPKTSTDILHAIRLKRSTGARGGGGGGSAKAGGVSDPYTLTFVGVNGVGKSTNLSKVAFWLLQNDFRVLIAACDTFRSGAVEQLRVHVRNLGMLVDRDMEEEGGEEGEEKKQGERKRRIELYERGYGKDAAGIAKDAIGYGKENGFDVVLIDTAGRMQDNEPLMRALAKLVAMNQPDKIVFVGEALVGNEAVDQLVKFDRALRDFTSGGKSGGGGGGGGATGGGGQTASGGGRGIDGMLVTKWDTVDDKVGAALSMTFVTGQPILFVGCGQEYSVENLYFYIWLNQYQSEWTEWANRIRPKQSLDTDATLNSVNNVHDEKDEEDEDDEEDEEEDEDEERREKATRPRFSSSSLDDAKPDRHLAMSYLRAKQTFFTPGSRWELNLPQKTLQQLLHPSEDQRHPGPRSHPHPSAFASVRYEVENYLNASLARFIVQNGGNAGRQRGLFAIAAGLLTIAIGLLPIILTSLPYMPAGPNNNHNNNNAIHHHYRRPWSKKLERLTSIPPLWVGFATLLAGLHGVCVIIFLFGDARQLYPYELKRPPISSPIACAPDLRQLNPNLIANSTRTAKRRRDGTEQRGRSVIGSGAGSGTRRVSGGSVGIHADVGVDANSAGTRRGMGVVLNERGEETDRNDAKYIVASPGPGHRASLSPRAHGQQQMTAGMENGRRRRRRKEESDDEEEEEEEIDGNGNSTNRRHHVNLDGGEAREGGAKLPRATSAASDMLKGARTTTTKATRRGTADTATTVVVRPVTMNAGGAGGYKMYGGGSMEEEEMEDDGFEMKKGSMLRTRTRSRSRSRSPSPSTSHSVGFEMEGGGNRAFRISIPYGDVPLHSPISAMTYGTATHPDMPLVFNFDALPLPPGMRAPDWKVREESHATSSMMGNTLASPSSSSMPYGGGGGGGIELESGIRRGGAAWRNGDSRRWWERWMAALREWDW